MESGKSGYVDFTGSSGFTIRVNWAQTYDVQACESTVAVTSVQIKAAYYNAVTYYLDGAVSVDGKTAIAMKSLAGTHSYRGAVLNQFKNISGNMGSVSGIAHEEDGSKSVVISVDIIGYTADGKAGSGWWAKGSVAVELDTIPRASTLDALFCDSNYFTGELTYRYTPKSSAFHNRVEISLNRSGKTEAVKVIALGQKPAAQQTGSAALDSAELAAVYRKLPDSVSGILRFTLYTYSDSGYTAQVGNASYLEITLTVPNDATTKPKMSMTLSPEGSLPDAFKGLHIKGKTKVKAVFECSSETSSVKSCELAVSGMTASGNPAVSGILPVSGEVKVTGTVTDARGYAASVSQTITVLPYDLPRVVPCNGQNMVVCERCLADGTPDPGGLNLLIKAGRMYSPVAPGGVQKNFCTLRYRYKEATAERYSEWITLIGAEDVLADELSLVAVGLVPSAMTAYHVQIGVLDTMGGQPPEMEFVIPTDEVAFHLKAGGKGAAFGMYAQADYRLDLEPQWEFGLRGQIMADFVLEQGNAEGWTYRKWYSGIGECWITAEAIPDSFPILFVDTPKRFSENAFGGNGYDIYAVGLWK